MIELEFNIDGKEDWLELKLMIEYRKISKANIIRFISTSNEYIEENEIELIADNLIMSFEKRQDLYNPELFKVEDNVIRPLKNWCQIPEYFLCVYLSFSGAYKEHDGTSLFENISAIALENFLNIDSYVIGFPNTTNFNKTLDELALRFNEQRGIPANSYKKDDGVDVVGYKLFNDKRSSNIYILLQCAAGYNWEKKKPINLERWTNYIFWFKSNIITGISITEILSDDKFYNTSADYGLILDRVRIFNNYYLSKNKELEKKVIKWIEGKN